MSGFDPYHAIRVLFCRIFCPCNCKEERRRPQARVTLAAGSIAVTFIPKGPFMFTLPSDKTASASLSYVDDKGNPAKVDGAPVWSSSDEAVLTVVAADDGMSAVVTPVGLGNAQIRIDADADLGAGVESLTTLADVEVVGGKAVAGNVALVLN